MMKYEVRLIENEQYADFEGDRGLFDAYLPVTEEKVPAFLYFHGGGLEAGCKGGGMKPVFTELARRGVAIFDANYRMFPQVGFPVFLEDSARCAAYLRQNSGRYGKFDRWYLGGSSAGGYISMMLAFNRQYLAAYGLDCERDFAGYLLDAGQPTTHFNILRKRGEDSRKVRVDEAAPIYFVDHEQKDPQQLPKLQIVCAERDMVGRLEQNRMLYRTLLHFGYPEELLQFRFMPGYSHCGYTGEVRPDGTIPFAELACDLIFWKGKQDDFAGR